MTPEEIGLLQQQLYALQADNAALRAELHRLAQQQHAQGQRREQVLRGGGRLLIPLLDRHKVVRSFGKLVETTGGFTGAREQWPSREQIIDDARVFLESMVRFAVRRRTLLLVLGLLGALIPLIQIWLVVQQNEIIDKQTEIIEEQRKHSEIQVYDLVARSMTEGDRNAKLMTGALLSRADPKFLAGVIEEAFDPELQGVYDRSGTGAASRRLEDAAFRGHLLRAAVRGIHRLAVVDGQAAAEAALPSLRRMVVDAQDRVPAVLRLGERDDGADGALDEQIDGYLVQLGVATRLYARLLRAQGRGAELFEDLRPLVQRVKWSQLGTSRFAKAQVEALRGLLLELALEPGVADDLLPDWRAAGMTLEDAYAKGLGRLREGVGEGSAKDPIDWAALAEQVG